MKQYSNKYMVDHQETKSLILDKVIENNGVIKFNTPFNITFNLPENGKFVSHTSLVLCLEYSTISHEVHVITKDKFNQHIWLTDLWDSSLEEIYNIIK